MIQTNFGPLTCFWLLFLKDDEVLFLLQDTKKKLLSKYQSVIGLGLKHNIQAYFKVSTARTITNIFSEIRIKNIVDTSK